MWLTIRIARLTECRLDVELLTVPEYVQRHGITRPNAASSSDVRLWLESIVRTINRSNYVTFFQAGSIGRATAYHPGLAAVLARSE